MLKHKKYGYQRNRSPRKDRAFSKSDRQKKKFDVYIPHPSLFDNYTPLNASIEQILHAIGNEKYVRKLWPAKPKPNADRSKRCDYH